MPRLVIATSNPHKIAEISAVLASVAPGSVAPCSLAEFAARRRLTEPTETGTTFEENARIKAISYAEQTGELCLADDSGLEIDALRGGPGVISSHYCTDGREAGMSRAERDAANNDRVLRELEGVPPERRSARFVCVMVLAGVPGNERGSAPRVLAVSRGFFDGRIGEPPDVPRGEGGFGYDPIFLVAPEYTSTSAELSPERKNALSHRGAALRDMAERLRGLFAG